MNEVFYKNEVLQRIPENFSTCERSYPEDEVNEWEINPQSLVLTEFIDKIIQVSVIE